MIADNEIEQNLPKKFESNEEFVKYNQKMEEIKKKLANSSEVIDFVNTQSKFIERILGEKSLLGLLNSYEEVDTVEKIEEDQHHEDFKEKKKLEKPISLMGNFFDESIVFKRAVTDLQWSNKFPELLLAGYSKSDESMVNDPHGLVVLWSLAMRKKPEYTFTCQSELTKVMLHPYNPKLILGSTHTGQILIWDTRGKALPIMKTPPGGKYHSHPIYCLNVVGSSSNNNIVSISNDGILCTWATNSLSKATKRIELKAKKKKITQNDFDGEMITKPSGTNYDEFGVICLATQEGDSNNMFIGTDDSEIYQISAHQG